MKFDLKTLAEIVTMLICLAGLVGSGCAFYAIRKLNRELKKKDGP